MDYQSEIILLLKKHVPADSEIKLEIPPDKNLGDFAFPCFSIAKHFKKSPQLIAHDLAAKMSGSKPDILQSVTANGPYVNFTLHKKNLSTTVLQQIFSLKENYGKQCQSQKIMVEFSSPNTNKPLHLGHVRNIALGDSISRIFAFLGNTVIKACLINDRGIHICKSMLAYKKWGHNKNPDKKGDFFVGDFYVLFAKKAAEEPKLEEEAQELLRQWELGDKEVVALWKKMNRWVYDGFEKTYATLGISFDTYYYESAIYLNGKELVLDGLKKGFFIKKEGAVVALLQDMDLPDKVLIRSDGTTIYMTQDLYLAQKKFEDFPIERSIYVVGSEQNMHFQQLFAILKKMKYPWAEQCYHLSYGMVLLPEGKMKSREGTVVDADTLMQELETLAKTEIKKRHPEISSVILSHRSKQVSFAALKFHMLKIDPAKDLVYDPKESISFEGETGPYVQYTHARISSILRKWGTFVEEEKNVALYLGERELVLSSLLEKFPPAVADAAGHYKPSYLCRYLLELCQETNSYYHEVPVLKEENEDVKLSRLYLLSCIKTVLQNGLVLLGIEAPEEM